ncbi:MAG: hypothetical protein K6F52_00230 [Clostridia bacterium]|nr:hypothetical protein [Clostridia bacterium]
MEKKSERQKERQAPEQTPKQAARPYDIHCPSCGAPAYYDIRSHVYKCRYCGMKVGIDKAIKNHKGFRAIQKNKMKESLKNFELQRGACTGCGAEVVFDKSNAVANCAFCGRSLVRREFANADDIPELVIPFAITKEEAAKLLTEWCGRHRGKEEAKAVLEKTADIKGCYLPYELVRGPVGCSVRRIDGGQKYECGGFIDEVFVNCSAGLDNRLLDGMEPYNLDELTEFDFAYIAGHQVKVSDITGDELTGRINVEVRDDYETVIQKTLEAKAVDINVDSSEIVRMPVLLPVYYLAFDGYMAAVNGQTGKVSVRAIKDSHHYILPWWLKALLWTGVSIAVITTVMRLLGGGEDLMTVAACLSAFLLIVLLVAYSQNMVKEFRVDASRKIFTSKGGPYVRKDGVLRQNTEEIVKPQTKPLFFMNIDGKREAVELKFTTVYRLVRMLAAAVIVNFFPVIIALCINGFDFAKLYLPGAVIWFCITVPLTPVVLIKFGRIDLYDNPWIYKIDEEGKKKRYKKPFKIGYSAGDIVKTTLKILFKPPGSIAVWFGILCFGMTIYMTAFGSF